MIEINLVPDVKQELIKAQRIRSSVVSLAIIIGIAAISLVVVLAIFAGGQSVASGFADRSIESESEKLQDVEDISNMLTIQNQLTMLSEQHDNKLINSRLFDILAAVNPPSPNNIRVSSLRQDPELGVLTIEGSASNGYAAVEAFKKTLLSAQVEFTQDSEPSSVPLTSVVNIADTSYGEDASGQRILRFSMSFEYAPEVFARSTQNARIVTPSTEQDVTDSRTRVPDSLFTDANSDIRENQ